MALHFQKIALQKMAKGLTISLVGVLAAAFALSQTAAAPFFSFAALGNMIALAGTQIALGKMPPHV
ncbi:hypothetical protein [Geoalkalibacter halelectricus]|uniref:hypothetical protein n=1 Tax=Geoalkalibacter halelectricus TaxID=2847045 RepID=UPI003D1B2352